MYKLLERENQSWTISSLSSQSGDTPPYPPALRLLVEIAVPPILNQSTHGGNDQKEAMTPSGQRARLEYEKRAAGAHLRQFADEVMSVRFLRGFDHLLLGDAVVPVTDILPYRCVEQHRLLADHADMRA